MKKTGILNRDIATVLSQLGHTDTIVVGDCGLPIPQHIKCIDLSMDLGTPSLVDVIRLIMKHMEVEKITMASEIKLQNTRLDHEITSTYGNIPLDYVFHEDFKKAMSDTKAVIRTGEATPFANVMLRSGVIF